MTKKLEEIHPELFHYTNAKGLVGIIESQSIWATNYRYLNDSTEVKFFSQNYLPNLLQPICEKYLNELIAEDSDTQKLIDQRGGRKGIIDSYIRDTLDVHEKIFLDKQNAGAALVEPYIASFCTASGLEKSVCDQVTEHGLLSQWRGYGYEGGYAIVFDTARLSQLIEDAKKKWINGLDLKIDEVVYSSSNLEEKIKEDLKVIKGFYSSNLRKRDEYVEEIYFSLTRCTCFYKHWGFGEENEVRIVTLPLYSENKDFLEAMRVDGEEVDKIPKNFFLRDGTLVPYIDLFKDVTSKHSKSLPIRRIIVGPTVNEEERNRRVNAVKMLIDQHDIKAEVTPSDIPFVGAAR